MKLSGRIKKIRLTEKLTQGKMAARMGIALSTYQYYERGERIPPADFLSGLIGAFGVDPNWLLTGKGVVYPGSMSAAETSPAYGASAKKENHLAHDRELAEIVAWLTESPKQKKLIHQLMVHEKGSKAILKKLME